MPWGVCQRCGFRYELSEIKTEWTNLKVCRSCFDFRPTQLSPPNVMPEGVPLIDAAPEPDFNGVEYGRPFDDTFFDTALFDASGDVAESDL